MADNTGSGNTALGMIVGILLVAVVGLGVFMYTGGHFGAPQPTSTFQVDVHTPKAPGS